MDRQYKGMYRDRTLPLLGMCKLCAKCAMCAKYVQSLLYKCTRNQFTIIQVYTKPVYCTSVHKTCLLYKCNWSIKKGMYMDRQY